MSNSNVMVRFERGQHDKWSQEFGPFEFIQLTYEGLRISPDGEWLANYMNGFWMLTDEYLKTITPDELTQEWSDVVIYPSNLDNEERSHESTCPQRVGSECTCGAFEHNERVRGATT